MDKLDDLTNDKAREVFKESGLDYNDVYDFLPVMVQAIQSNIDEHCEKHDSLPMTVCDGYYPVKYMRNTRNITSFFVYVDGSYFTRRECVSFNPDGFIGFAGWASSLNVAPILQGFVDAVELIKKLKAWRNPEKDPPASKTGSGCVHFGSEIITDGPLMGLHYCDSCGWVHADGSDYFQLIEKSRP